MRSLARSALEAGRLVADRTDLWTPAALAAIAFLSWLPFVLAIVPLPSPADLAFFGAGLYTSSRWPINAVELVGGIGLLALGASLLIALGEAALQRRLHDPVVSAGSLADDTARIWLVQVVAAVPAFAAAGLLLLGVARVAPGEYQSPDIGGPLLLRIARDVAPLAALLLVAVLLGQAFGAAATRRAALRPQDRVVDCLAAGVRDLLHRGGRLAALATISFAVQVASLLLAVVLLRVLWSPIGLQLADRRLGGPQTLLLLVGFVAIWLCLLVGSGVLHAWASAWWTLELDPGASEPAAPVSRVEGIGQA